MRNRIGYKIDEQIRNKTYSESEARNLGCFLYLDPDPETPGVEVIVLLLGTFGVAFDSDSESESSKYLGILFEVPGVPLESESEDPSDLDLKILFDVPSPEFAEFESDSEDPFSERNFNILFGTDAWGFRDFVSEVSEVL